MKAAHHPVQRPRDAKLLVVSAGGLLQYAARRELARFFRRGDLLVANDAATLPASLAGIHLRSGAPVEVRLAGRRSLAVDDLREFSAVVFGAGDHRTRTEDRAAPPPLRAGDTLTLGPLRASVLRLLGHARLVALAFDGTPDAIWAGLASHGRPVQYAHVNEPLALWDVWTRVAAQPVAFEPPSAGFVIDWQLLHALKEGGVEFATLTHAAGLSSTGDAALDARLPFDEPYHLPQATVDAIAATRQRGGRVIALGTTVTRALEHAASLGPLRAGEGLADQKLGADSALRVVDAIVSGTHEPGTSHYELLRAFASDAVLARADAALLANGYRTHEFGDSVLVERGGGHPAPPTARHRSSTPVRHGTNHGTIAPVTSKPTTAQHLRDLARLRRVRDRIDREYAQPLDVEALARGIHMSAGHLSRQFRLAYGESVYSYLMTRRIERAMALLRRGDLSVTEVCFEVGCASLGTFSTRFTELVGMSPSAYRRQGAPETAGIPSCVSKQVTRPIRNREAPVTDPPLD